MIMYYINRSIMHYAAGTSHTQTSPTHMILIKPEQQVIESIDRSTVRGAITDFVQLIRGSRIQLICRDYCLIAQLVIPKNQIQTH